MTAWGQDRGLEFRAPLEIRQVQERLLAAHLEYAATSSPFYRDLLDGRRLSAASPLETLRELPCTDKQHLSERNDDFLAVPMARIVDVALSSGTTCRPTTVMYTENDLKRLAYNEEISFASCGMNADDLVLLTCTLDRCFIGGYAYFAGVRSLGAAAIRNGLGSFESHWELIRRLKPTVLVGVPTFLLKLGWYLKSQGVDPASTGVRKAVCIGEPIRDRDLRFLKAGKLLEELWGFSIYSTYASSETVTSFCECTAQQGGHLHPDLALVEILDEAGNPLPPGEPGEVVTTPLGIEGMPLLRFKTGDISFLSEEPCRCGRNSPRLGPILGRKNQMIKFRGTTLYPQSIFSVLDGLPAVSDYYVTATREYHLSDTVRVYVALSDPSCRPEAIMDKLQAHLRVRPEVCVVTEAQIRSQLVAGNSRKAIRFVDQRDAL